MMEIETQKNDLKAAMSVAGQSPAVPQMPVRSDLRSGGDLETCQYNLNKWRERYNYWYNLARQRGKI